MAKRLDDNVLRQHLSRLTNGAPDAQTVPRGIGAFAETNRHSIRLVSAATWRRETWAFNFHTYALGLQARVTRTPFPDRKFMRVGSSTRR